MNVQMAIAIAAAILVSPSSSFAQSKGVYGGDDREDLFAAPRSMQALSDSVVSLWKADSVEMSGSGGVKLHTMNFGEQFNLCPDERFREQPIGSFCSGALVGEDLVITAGHCIRNRDDCANTRIVFGYAVKKAGQAAATRLPAGEVYGCARILRRSSGIGRGYGEVTGPDFAVIRLDRKVAGHKPLAVNRGAEIGKGAPLFVIGHPVGLPLKVAGGASVREFAAGGYFIADLDAFGGNSGSPVFNAKTGLIEGVIARGDRDFVTSPAGCTAVTAYAQSGGDGEAVTKIAMFSDFIPAVDGPDAGASPAKAVNVDAGSIQSGTDAALLGTLSFD